MTVRTRGGAGRRRGDADEAAESGAAANATAIGGAPLDEATRLAAEVKNIDASALPRAAKGKDAEVRIESLDELVEFFIAAGKKGFDDQPLQGPRRDEPGHALGNHDGSRRSARCSRSRPKTTRKPT